MGELAAWEEKVEMVAKAVKDEMLVVEVGLKTTVVIGAEEVTVETPDEEVEAAMALMEASLAM